MTTRTPPLDGAPCWADLWTSDVGASRRFYQQLFGWEGHEPDPNYGGYFLWTRDGVPVAGGMGDRGPDLPGDNTWKPYLATSDVSRTVGMAEAAGARIEVAGMRVGDMGIQATITDPTGATVGLWQPIDFPGFTLGREHGAPSWVELHTAQHGPAVSFYQGLFDYESTMAGDTDEFRYATLRPAGGDDELIGIMDASTWLPDRSGSAWSLYWQVDDIHRSADTVTELGGTVIQAPEETPYGWLATAADPTGARFRLRGSNA